MKKCISMLMALMMILSLATTAFATDITIDGGANGSEYAAYKLLNATDGGDGKFAYTLNEKYAAILQKVTGKTEQADIVAYIAALKVDGIRTFADDVYAEIVALNADDNADNNIAADYTADNKVFSEVAQGYYLIAETQVGNAADTFSLVMLDTAGADNITVNTKEDVPSVEKKVEEKNDSTGETSWGDGADHDVGDVINYKITGTVSSKYADYKSYYYSFSDTMDDGLTMNSGSVKVMIGDVDVTSQFTITYAEHAFTATANLKELTGVTITGETEVIVTYTATLNENAVSGSAGNKNTVKLEYENNPYHEGDGNPATPDEPEEPGKTPEDTNVVFTYDVIVNKVDGDKKPLEGAGFTLYKWKEVTPATEEAGAVYGWVAVGAEITGETVFAFEKLDEGKYKLVETTVPDGYNKAPDVEFEVTSTISGETLSGLTVAPAEGFTVNLESGKIQTDVENLSGTELPETGGMGTTMFYIFGGIMVLAAVVLLVTKKRMAYVQ